MEEGQHDCKYQLQMTFPKTDGIYINPLQEFTERFDDERSTDSDVSSREESDFNHASSTPLHPQLTSIVGEDVFYLQNESEASFINSRIEFGDEKGAFLVSNLAMVEAQLHLWKRELPMVTPFYAVKCLPEPAIVRMLASLGCGFDCASLGELDLVINGLGKDLSFGRRGLSASHIVYANPAKMEHMLRFAIDHDVRMTVFDGEDELYKIAAMDGGADLDLLLRLTTEDKASVCQFSKKFGCPVSDAPRLLKIANSLGLNVTGVSFHVGSGCGDVSAYRTAFDHARLVFESAEALGMAALRTIDIGGGFPGDTGGYGGPGMPTFQDIAQAVRESIDQFLEVTGRSADDIRVIAEPGRFFASACTTAVTKVYARKGGYGPNQALYVDDGVYGSFNNVLYDHATPVPMRLEDAVAASAQIPSLPCPPSKISASSFSTSSSFLSKFKGKNSLFSRPSHQPSSSSSEDLLVADSGKKRDLAPIPTVVFGPTCDGLDQMCSMESTSLPRCEINDWLVWANMGAYTHTASFVFNGYTHIPPRRYVYLPCQ